MSNDKKVKIYKNPKRNEPDAHKPYVPQYQVHAVEPEEIRSATVPSNTTIARPSALPSDNPRSKREVIRQPYATAVPSPIGKGPPPNVGNNLELTWSSVDGVIVDDLSGESEHMEPLDPNHQMIDNNDFVTPQAMGFQNGLTADDINPVEKKTFLLEEELEGMMEASDNEEQDKLTVCLQNIISDLEEDSYMVLVEGLPVCSGTQEQAQDEARKLIFGEHKFCLDGNPVSPDDIIILKRVKIKVGLFIE